MLASYLGVGGCREEKCVSLLLLLGVGGCREEKCVSLPSCLGSFLPGWVGVGRRNVLASYLGVGGCREEKCVSLLPRCGLVSGGEMC